MARPARRLWWAAGGAWAALHLVLAWLERHPDPRRLWGDESMYWEAAERVLRSGASGIEPLWPPLYPWFLAACRTLADARWPVELAQALLLVAVAWLLRDIGRRLALPPAAADGAAVLVLLYPTLAAFAHFAWPEVLHLAWLVGSAWILVARRERPAWCLLLGATLGLALLTKSLLGPFLPVLLAPLVARGAWSRRLACLAAALLALAAVVAPTVAANWRAHGRPMIANSALFNLWVGLNDRSTRNFVDPIVTREYVAWRRSAPDLAGRERILGEKIRRHVGERGWAGVVRDQVSRQYLRLLDRESFLTDQLPGGAIFAAGGGYARPPAPLAAAVRGAHYAAYAGLLAAVPFGLASALAQRRRWAWIGTLFLAYHAAIFLLLHVKTRYRLQLAPLAFLLAALAAVEWVGWWRARRRGARVEAPLGRRGAALAAAVAALLLGLAFGPF